MIAPGAHPGPTRLMTVLLSSATRSNDEPGAYDLRPASPQIEIGLRLTTHAHTPSVRPSPGTAVWPSECSAHRRDERSGMPKHLLEPARLRDLRIRRHPPATSGDQGDVLGERPDTADMRGDRLPNGPDRRGAWARRRLRLKIRSAPRLAATNERSHNTGRPPVTATRAPEI